MRAKFIHLFTLIAVLAPVLGVANLALAAQAPQTPPRATFTVSVASAFAREAPDLTTAGVRPVFGGQTFLVRARTADSRWLGLHAPGSKTDVWVLATWGMVSGNLEQVPVIGAAGTPLYPWMLREGCG